MGEEIQEYKKIKVFTPDVDTGLTEEQVRERLENGLDNKSVESPSKTTKEIIRENVFTYFNFIFAAFTVLLLLVGAYKDLTFLPVIIANTLIGTIQELKAKSVLDELRMLTSTKAKVIRGGYVEKVDTSELVRDDVVIFSMGNQIYADAVVLSGKVQVNESLITGESDEITKKPGDELISGSYIVSGEARCVLRKVGYDSYISKLTTEAKKSKGKNDSEMIKSINRLLIVIGILIIPIGGLLFYQQYFLKGETLKLSVTSMIAAVIGMVPEGLYLLTAITLAVSSVVLARKRVLVQDMKCIETLARVNVLCVDKTGTITEDEMKVDKYIEDPYYREYNLPPFKELVALVSGALPDDNRTIITIKEDIRDLRSKTSNINVLSYTSFSSKYKYSSVTTDIGSFVLGAAELVLKENYQRYKDQLERYSKQGYRVLVFTRYKGSIVPDEPLTEDSDVLGFILISNPIRKNAADTFAYFERQNVEIKVISGDNPVTTSTVAKRAGIKNAEKYIDVSEIKTEAQLRKIAPNYTVFGRVNPEQKRVIIESLQDMGKTVAMTGDGVNDVLALKKADCSIAMASGSEVAGSVAQLLLLDSDFSCMPSVVLEGRKVVNNIQRSASLFLSKNIFSLILSIFSLLFVITYPLEPSQISFIGAFTIGIPAFFLAQEPNNNIIRGRFIRNVLVNALPAGLTSFIVVCAMVIFGMHFNVSNADISVAAALLFAEVGFMILFRISRPLNVYRTIVCVSCMVVLVISSLILGDFFGIRSISVDCIMLLCVFAIIAEPTIRLIDFIMKQCDLLVKKVKRFVSEINL